MSEELEKINTLVKKESEFVEKLLNETQKKVIGQTPVLERLLIGVLTGGHILLEGVPGLAKTLAIKTLSQAVNVKFNRIQFTPDLLPADILGTMIYNPKTREFAPKPGPIFANFILADEINRAPAKVQSALLEAMQEQQVTIGEHSYKLSPPFLVLATQNPVEQEGTYPLPEAQVDRFMMKIKIDYPSKENERLILKFLEIPEETTQKIISPENIQNAQKVVSQIYVDEKIKDYVLDLIFATRDPGSYGLENLKPLIQYGASPRASLFLIQAAKAHAFIRQRGYVSPEDIKAIGKDVLRHRVIPSFEAEAEEMDSEKILDRIFTSIEVP